MVDTSNLKISPRIVLGNKDSVVNIPFIPLASPAVALHPLRIPVKNLL